MYIVRHNNSIVQHLKIKIKITVFFIITFFNTLVTSLFTWTPFITPTVALLMVTFPWMLNETIVLFFRLRFWVTTKSFNDLPFNLFTRKFCTEKKKCGCLLLKSKIKFFKHLSNRQNERVKAMFLRQRTTPQFATIVNWCRLFFL